MATCTTVMPKTIIVFCNYYNTKINGICLLREHSTFIFYLIISICYPLIPFFYWIFLWHFGCYAGWRFPLWSAEIIPPNRGCLVLVSKRVVETYGLKLSVWVLFSHTVLMRIRKFETPISEVVLRALTKFSISWFISVLPLIPMMFLVPIPKMIMETEMRSEVTATICNKKEIEEKNDGERSN